MNSVRYGMLNLGRWGFACRYQGGFTVRALQRVVIVRWHTYVPADLAGRRVRLGPVEIHWRTAR